MWLMPLLGVLATSAEAQMFPGGMKMAEPSAPRPGDAAMTCEQLAREMHDIMKKKNLGKDAPQALEAGCELKRAAPTAAEYAAMTAPSPTAVTAQRNKAAEMSRTAAPVMAHAMTTMTALNDPRLMRLAMLSEEKQCAAALEPPQERVEQVDACGNEQPETLRASSPMPGNPGSADPFRAAQPPPSPASDGASDPFAQRAAPAPSKK
jgi:hypothetical protein